jgi:hypothetical protein
MKTTTLLFCLLTILLLTGCLPGQNTSEDIPGADGTLAGFWSGLWHGFISPVTFIISLITDKINFYEVHNNGGWYNFGFVLGAGIIFGGGSKASSRKNR